MVMGLEDAKLFIEKMKSDEAFRSKIMEVDDIHSRMMRIKELGYDCTLEEIREVSERLSEGDLDKVAGGTEERLIPNCLFVST